MVPGGSLWDALYHSEVCEPSQGTGSSGCGMVLFSFSPLLPFSSSWYWRGCRGRGQIHTGLLHNTLPSPPLPSPLSPYAYLRA